MQRDSIVLVLLYLHLTVWVLFLVTTGHLDQGVLDMVSFANAVKFGFQRYFDFSGRSTRAEFWCGVYLLVLAAYIKNR